MTRKPAVLLILDGYGLAPAAPNNAIAAANTPSINAWRARCSTVLEASGTAVGLPEGQMGSSEVNHLNMGAGRVVPQDIVRINEAIKNDELSTNQALKKAFDTTGTVHFLGLVSDGGVHSTLNHLLALLKEAKKLNKHAVVHAILDGRDTPPRTAAKYLTILEEEGAIIATIIGRFYAMDRDKRWERTRTAYNALQNIDTPKANWREWLAKSYAEEQGDEFVVPAIINEHPVKDGDAIVFFNFRADRTRQLTEAYIKQGFADFWRANPPSITFVTMTEYDKEFQVPALFPPLTITNGLSEWLSTHSETQLHIAETEKYAHVTYFFNGGREEPFPGETRIIIQSPKVRTYDLSPRMSVDAITDAVLANIEEDKHDAYIINFANADMVGHTGVYEATIEAVEAIDQNIARLSQAVLDKKGFLIITADHGNAEEMTGAHQTSHTLNPVPFIIVDEKTYALRPHGIVPDVAPTMLELMGIPIPQEMTAHSLLLRD